MKTSVKTELLNHILDRINDGVIDNSNKDEWHFYCFNEDYYIIGYYEASEWLKKHEIGEFEAAGICQQYEKDNFGESKVYDNSEMTVNMLAYIWGEELIYSFDVETVEELQEEINDILNY
jgi:hypothetical protein